MTSKAAALALGTLLLAALTSAKSKKKYSPKQKKPKEICLESALLFEIGGSTETVTGSTLSELFGAPETNNTECDEFVAATNLDAYLKCVQRQGWAATPFWYNAGVGSSATFEFNEEQQAIGDGAFCGTVGDVAKDKVRINYYEDEFYNTSTAIEKIQYQYFIEECGDALTPPCDEQFYLNVYLREPGSTVFYDCKYDFVPPDNVAGVGDWRTFTVLSTDTPSSVTEGCPGTLKAAFDEGYVLGAAPGIEYILAFNMGDTSLNDIELKGYFDDIQIKYEGEDLRIYDLEPPNRRGGSSSETSTV